MIIGEDLFQVNNSKVNKSDEISKYVMAEMRILAHVHVVFEKLLKAKNLPCIGAIDMFRVSNWYYLIEAIEIYTKKSNDSNDNMNVSDEITYGIKKSMYYTFRNAAKILRTYGTLNKLSIYSVEDLSSFKCVWNGQRKRVFGDATACIVKSRSERLRLPSRTIEEETIAVLSNHTLESLSEMSWLKLEDVDKKAFITIRDLLICRLTLFNARRGGEVK